MVGDLALSYAMVGDLALYDVLLMNSKFHSLYDFTRTETWLAEEGIDLSAEDGFALRASHISYLDSTPFSSLEECIDAYSLSYLYTRYTRISTSRGQCYNVTCIASHKYIPIR